jgi:hypothetical protein
MLIQALLLLFCLLRNRLRQEAEAEAQKAAAEEAERAGPSRSGESKDPVFLTPRKTSTLHGEAGVVNLPGARAHRRTHAHRHCTHTQVYTHTHTLTHSLTHSCMYFPLCLPVRNSVI